MNNNIYSDRGIKITDNILKIGYTTISLSSISSVHTFPVPRHSLLAGLKEWFYGLIFMIIICAIFTQISILGDIYIFTIFILIGYNIYEHRKVYLGLEICTTGGQSYKIKSEDIVSITKIERNLTEFMEENNPGYNINLNNSIINNGNNNKNTVVHK